MADIPRTLAIIGELARGKRLILPIGSIGMGADMSIGFLLSDGRGHDTVGGLSTMDLKQLDELLTQHNIGFPVPDSV